MPKDLLALLYYNTIPHSLNQVLEENKRLSEIKRKQRIKEGYKIVIVWKFYLSHRSTEENKITLKTPTSIENLLSKQEWEFDLAESVMARYGIRPSRVVQ